jgi:hypothetical protein
VHLSYSCFFLSQLRGIWNCIQSVIFFLFSFGPNFFMFMHPSCCLFYFIVFHPSFFESRSAYSMFVLFFFLSQLCKCWDCIHHASFFFFLLQLWGSLKCTSPSSFSVCSSIIPDGTGSSPSWSFFVSVWILIDCSCIRSQGTSMVQVTSRGTTQMKT